MRNLIPLCVLGALALGLAGCGGDGSDEQTLTLNSKGGHTLSIEDNGRRGPSPADERSFSLALVTEDGRPAGRLDGNTTNTAIVGGLEQRVGTVQYTLKGGTIVVSGVYLARPGVFVPARGITRPIVGGTGKYKGARGEAVQTPIAGGEIRNVLEFTTGG
jgi:hypothetical protein